MDLGQFFYSRIHNDQPAERGRSAVVGCFYGQLYIYVKLPFLKNSKWPRIAPKQDEKLVNASSSDHLEDFCMEELMDAAKNRDVKGFLAALEALVHSCFEESDEGKEA